MTTKALTFEFTISGGDCFEKTFEASTVATAWLKAARYAFCHGTLRVVGIRLLRQRRIAATALIHQALSPAIQSSLFLLTK